jgi:hypothetical protein
VFGLLAGNTVWGRKREIERETEREREETSTSWKIT